MNPLKLSALVAVAALAGCSFTYENPAEKLRPGEVAGRTVAGTQLFIDGVAVALAGSALDGVSRTGGRFSMLPLPPGNHTLVFRKGDGRALQRDVEIRYGSDGQPEGLWLGDVDVPATGAIGGRILYDSTFYLGDNGVAVDEVTGMMVPLDWDEFYFPSLPQGPHRIRVYATDEWGSPLVAGPASVTILPQDAGTVKQLAGMPVRYATGAPATVKLRLRLVGDFPGLSLADVKVLGLPAQVIFDSSGLGQVEVPEGKYTVSLMLPPAASTAYPPREVTIVAIEGQTYDLGSLYLVTDSALNQAQFGCRADLDCAPGGSCVDGYCQGWSPPWITSANIPYCDVSNYYSRTCTAWGPCNGGGSAPVTASCESADSSTIPQACVPCGTCCTPDGQELYCAIPGQNGCPVAYIPLAVSPIDPAVPGCLAPGTDFTATGGVPPYSWINSDYLSILLVVSPDTTTATWQDSFETYCTGTPPNVIITVTDSIGSTASTSLTILMP
jgi:hypothetical protein